MPVNKTWSADCSLQSVKRQLKVMQARPARAPAKHPATEYVDQVQNWAAPQNLRPNARWNHPFLRRNYPKGHILSSPHTGMLPGSPLEAYKGPWSHLSNPSPVQGFGPDQNFAHRKVWNRVLPEPYPGNDDIRGTGSDSRL